MCFVPPRHVHLRGITQRGQGQARLGGGLGVGVCASHSCLQGRSGFISLVRVRTGGSNNPSVFQLFVFFQLTCLEVRKSNMSQ